MASYGKPNLESRMSKLRTVAVITLIGALLVLTFLITTNGTLLGFFIPTEVSEEFTRFGVLYTSVTNYSVLYVDQEWLILNDQRRLAAAEASHLVASEERLIAEAAANISGGDGASIDALAEALPAPPLRAAQRDSINELFAGRVTPFFHDFPYYVWDGPIPKFSLRPNVAQDLQSVHILTSSTERNEILIHYLCRMTSSGAPRVIDTQVFLRNVYRPRTLKTWTERIKDENDNITFVAWM